MKSVSLYISLFVSGLTVCGLLVLRHACRTAPLVPPEPDMPAPPRRSLALPGNMPGGFRPDLSADLVPHGPATRRLQEKLRREELRQRPLEGRN